MLILASKSQIRQNVLKQVGVDFKVMTANVDERAEIAARGGETAFSPTEMASLLAKLKAQDVGKRAPSAAYVLGCDQVLGLEAKILHKAKSRDEAHARLSHLAGKTHHLHAGVALIHNGQVIWEHVATAALTMRNLSAAEIDTYLEKAGSSILDSVGCYQLEGRGAALFDRIDGDFFTILGLPLHPVLEALRTFTNIDPISPAQEATRP